MIPKLSSGPLSNICSFLDTKDKSSAAQVCKTLETTLFSRNAFSSETEYQLVKGIRFAKKTVYEFPDSIFKHSLKTTLYPTDDGIVLRNPNFISRYNKDGKELYKVDLDDDSNNYIGSNRKYFFYSSRDFVLPYLSIVDKVSGKTFSKSPPLPANFDIAQGIRCLKFFPTPHDDKGVLVFNNLVTQTAVGLYDCTTNQMGTVHVHDSGDPFGYPARSFRLKNYLYLLSHNNCTVLNIDDGLKPVVCNVPSFSKNYCIKVKGDKLFDFSNQNSVACYSNDDKGNIIKEWEQNLQLILDIDFIRISISKPFIAIESNPDFIYMRRMQRGIYVLDGEDGGKIIWSKTIQDKDASIPKAVKFFQKGILSTLERSEQGYTLKLRYFDPKTKKCSMLPPIQLAEFKKHGLFRHCDGISGQLDIDFVKNTIYIAYSVANMSTKSGIRIEKLEYQDKTANPVPIITKIGNSRKRTWKNIIKFFFLRVIRNVCACAKRVFCCKK